MSCRNERVINNIKFHKSKRKYRRLLVAFSSAFLVHVYKYDSLRLNDELKKKINTDFFFSQEATRRGSTVDIAEIDNC